MEKEKSYVVKLSAEAQHYFFQFLDYLYTHHSTESADKKSIELLNMAHSLRKQPYRGRKEEALTPLGKDFRFLLYRYTSKKTIKIIYFVDEKEREVYVTDFFPSEKSDKTIIERVRRDS